MSTSPKNDAIKHQVGEKHGIAGGIKSIELSKWNSAIKDKTFQRAKT